MWRVWPSPDASTLLVGAPSSIPTDEPNEVPGPSSGRVTGCHTCYTPAGMTLFYAGAVLDRAPGPKYVHSLAFAEIAPAEPLPRAATIAKWRQAFPSGFVPSFVVPAPARRSARGAFRFDDAMKAAFDWARESADALGARFVVVPTGSELTTGQRDRDLLAAWVEAFAAPEGRQIVWHPSGLWDPELAAPFAEKLGVVLAFDPLESVPPEGEPLIYARMRAIGLRSRFSETLLLEALDAVLGADADEVFVAIESPRSFKEASRLAELARDEA